VHWLGTKKGNSSWKNSARIGQLEVKFSSLAADSEPAYCVPLEIDMFVVFQNQKQINGFSIIVNLLRISYHEFTAAAARDSSRRLGYGSHKVTFFTKCRRLTMLTSNCFVCFQLQGCSSSYGIYLLL
jgi:hypothetical protein